MIFSTTREIRPPRSIGISTVATFHTDHWSSDLSAPYSLFTRLYWSGTQTMAVGTPFYPVQNYQFMLFLLPVLLFIAFFVMFAVPKTACQKLYDQRHVTD
ncbi:hypothetical protein [Coxiella endosymbiont of Ornithodoros amblus]|uniref:hypothetical protein n=1 Tax=Coxiella endosymbiont of Ornithodoros amblus TaxID=1656166 RepID=UPI003CC721E4